MEDIFGQQFPLPKKITQHCPLCGARLSENDLNVLEEDDRGVLIYSSCANCKVGMLARLHAVPQGFVGVGMLTDLQLKEIDLLGSTPVSAEDVLQVKQLADKGKLKIQ